MLPFLEVWQTAAILDFKMADVLPLFFAWLVSMKVFYLNFESKMIGFHCC